MVGGELKAYTELLQEARNEALQRMMMDAQARGANAIVNVRFATSAVSGGAAELFAYGTAGLGVASAIASVIMLFHFTIGIFLASKRFDFKIFQFILN